jgi:hypothetical protein
MALVVRKAKKVTYTTASGKKRTRKVILTKQEQRIADAYAQAISGLKGFTKSPQLYDNLRGLALGSGSVDSVVDSFDWAGFSMNLGDVPVTLLSQVSGEAGKQLATLRTALGTDVTYSFDVTDPRAVAWAQVKTGELVTSVKESTREAIRQTIYESINNGIDPMETAQRLTRVVGLLPRHASAVGKLYDNTLQRLVKDGVVEAEAKQKAREMADKYATRLVRYRAKMIARTEIQYANNMGRLLSWAEADNQGLLAGGLLKEWAVITPNSPYGKPCVHCAPMKGERVAWDKPFSNGLLMPPAHPHCRCTATPIVPTLDELRAMVQAKGVSPVSSDPFGFALQAEQLVQKHGDPSRPNYAQMHPNSPAVNGGFSRRTITKDDVRAQLENYLHRGQGKSKDDVMAALLPILSGETEDTQPLDAWVDDYQLHETNFYHAGDEVWTKTRQDGSPLDVVFSKDCGLTDADRQEATSFVSELDDKAYLGDKTEYGGVTVRVNNKDFSYRPNSLGFTYRNMDGNVISLNAGLWDRTGRLRQDNSVITEDTPWLGRIKQNHGRTFKMPVQSEVPQWKYTMTHEWGHLFDVRGDTQAKEQHGRGARAKNMSAYGRSDPREAYAEAFTQYFLTGGSIKLSTVKWYAEQNAWGSTVKL